MSDIGLGNLTQLKTFLLAEGLRQGEDFDTALTSIGKGVAASFDRFCNRTLARGDGVTEVFTANRDHWYTRRYPIESVSAVDLKNDDVSGWESQTVTDIIENISHESGRLYFGYEPGTWGELVRITYTGGFWFDTTENETGELPSGATQLPEDIVTAWLLQCQHAWAERDKLGTNIGQDAGLGNNLGTYELVPEVQRILNGRVRYNLT